MIVDSHCHVSPSWYEPVETLLYQMDSNQVERAVLVQMLGQSNNDYLFDCLARFPDRLVAVVGVIAEQAEAVSTLERLALQGASGVRLRPGTRSPGADPLAIWRTAERLGLAVSCVGTAVAFASAQFESLVAALPNLTIVLEHLGGTSRHDAGEEEERARLKVFELCRYPNVYLKLPGLGELAPRLPSLPATGSSFGPAGITLARAALARFGAGRLMWGSDFPPVSSREGYGNALRCSREALGDVAPEVSAAVFGGVAGAVFCKKSTM